MDGLKPSEIHWVAKNYIGVADGYLGDFSYASHREFYAAYCDLAIDPDAFPGKTTRERFLAILGGMEPRAQAAILEGVARRFPQGSESQRTPQARRYLLTLAKRCQQVAAVAGSDPVITSDTVQRALADAALLLQSSGPVSAVDRVHTALHGYLRTACRLAEIDLTQLVQDPRITHYFKALRQQHPALKDLGAQSDALKIVLSSLANIIDQLDPVRNRASMAHANEVLLGRDEALLVINLARALMQFLDAKLRDGAAHANIEPHFSEGPGANGAEARCCNEERSNRLDTPPIDDAILGHP